MTLICEMSLERAGSPAKAQAASLFNGTGNGNNGSPLFGTLQRGFTVSGQPNLDKKTSYMQLLNLDDIISRYLVLFVLNSSNNNKNNEVFIGLWSLLCKAIWEPFSKCFTLLTANKTRTSWDVSTLRHMIFLHCIFCCFFVLALFQSLFFFMPYEN